MGPVGFLRRSRTHLGGTMSTSVTKEPRASIGGGEKPGISTISFARSGGIRAFAADVDARACPRRRVPPLSVRRTTRRSPYAPDEKAHEEGRSDHRLGEGGDPGESDGARDLKKKAGAQKSIAVPGRSDDG